MGGKARVHELAKELGITSKELLAHLKGQGEFVRSASSTIDKPVASRVREFFSNSAEHRGPTREHDRPAQRTVLITPPHKIIAPQPSRAQLTGAQVSELCQAYRRAYARENYDAAIRRVFTNYQELYRVSRTVLRDVITEDKRSDPAAYAALRLARTSGKPVAARPIPSRPTPPERLNGHRPNPAPRGEPRPRIRHTGLPPASTDIHLEAVTDMVAKALDAPAREHIASDLAAFDPSGVGGYGYLGWRYTTTRTSPTGPSTWTAVDELAAIARIVDTSKHRLQHPDEAAGRILDCPALAGQALESGFGDLFDPDDIGRSAADERRRVQDKHAFLQRAVILTVANPQCAERLWQMLDQLRPPPQHQLVETTPQLQTAIEGLTSDLAAVEALLCADETALQAFVRRSQSELADLHNGRFDYLQAFRDAGTDSDHVTRRVIHGLSFAVLPQGEYLTTFLRELRASKRYNGYRHVDEQRLTVLEELQEHFGAHRCVWHEGSVSSRGVDNRYLILVIRATTGPDEDAVAISPLAGQHAPYIVRHECVDAHWSRIFELSKHEARQHGARRLRFNGEPDQYREMRKKIITLLECAPGDFHK